VVVWIKVVIFQEIKVIEKYVEKMERWWFKTVGGWYGSRMAWSKGGQVIGWYGSWRGW